MLFVFRSALNLTLNPILAFGLILLGGCGMQNAAERSAENSNRAANNSDTLLKLSHSAYVDGRTGAARDRRMQEIVRLESSKNLNAKLVSAAAYFNAFEFQLWKSDDVPGDTNERREALLSEGVAEFLRTIRAYVDFDQPINVGLNPQTPPSENQLTLLALALTLHRVSERQKEAAAVHHFKTLSMMDIIFESLTSSVPQESKNKATIAPAPRHVEEVRREARVAIWILAVREMGLFAAAVEKLKNPKEMLAVLSAPQDRPALERGWHASKANFFTKEEVNAVIEQLKGSLQVTEYLNSQALTRPPLEPLHRIVKQTIRPATLAESTDSGVSGTGPVGVELAAIWNTLNELIEKISQAASSTN